RQLLKPFLAWANRARLMPRLRIPPHRPGQQTPITQHRRLALLGVLVRNVSPAANESDRPDQCRRGRAG
ncbi:hypothetical protein F8271_28920, partial [Micromonospora sp. ALFpr18c]